MPMNILITGGSGDLAKKIKSELEGKNLLIANAPTSKELDVSSIESVETYFQDKKFDVVVNLAGTLYSSLVAESIPDLWIRDINVNLIGTYLVSRMAILKNKNVRIINISSTAAYNSYKDWTSYCASKAGVLKLSEGLFKDGYDVVILCPGAIKTKIRSGINIENSNVMELKEGVDPIINAILGKTVSGSIVVYRKDEKKTERIQV